jgi:hypothetical protein
MRKILTAFSNADGNIEVVVNPEFPIDDTRRLAREADLARRQE